MKAEFIPPVPTQQDVQFTMTKNEARTLMTLCGKVTGSSESSRRKHTDNLWDVLRHQLQLAEVPDSEIEGYFNFKVTSEVL